MRANNFHYLPSRNRKFGYVQFPDGSYTCEWAVLSKDIKDQDDWRWDEVVLLTYNGSHFFKFEPRDAPFYDYSLKFWNEETATTIVLSRQNLKRPLRNHVMTLEECKRKYRRVYWETRIMTNKWYMLAAAVLMAYGYQHSNEIGTLVQTGCTALVRIASTALVNGWNSYVYPCILAVARAPGVLLYYVLAYVCCFVKQYHIDPLVEWVQNSGSFDRINEIANKWVENGSVPIQTSIITALVLVFSVSFLFGAQYRKMQKQLENVGDSKKCVVCWDKVANRYHVPCGHSHLCQDCCKHVKNQCPVCCAPVKKFLPLYL